MRVPDAGSFAPLRPEQPVSTASVQEQAANATAALSLAEQLLKSPGLVVLEDFAQDFDAGQCTSAAIKGWMGLCVMGVLYLPGLFVLSETWVFIVLATPLAVWIMYTMESDLMHEESGTRKAQLDLQTRQLTIDHQMPGRSECYMRQVPFDALRLVLRSTASRVEGIDFWRKEIELQVPFDPSTPQFSGYLLFKCEDCEQERATALYQALLVHTGIPQAAEGFEAQPPLRRIRALS